MLIFCQGGARCVQAEAWAWCGAAQGEVMTWERVVVSVAWPGGKLGGDSASGEQRGTHIVFNLGVE